MKYIKGAVIFIIIILVLIFFGSLYLKNSAKKVILNTESVFFSIEPGDTLGRVAENLVEQGIVKKASSLIWMARFDDRGPILAANYEFPPNFTLDNLYTAITAGTSLSVEEQATLVEGLTLEQIADVLVKEGVIASADEFIIAASKGLTRFVDRFPILKSKPADQSLEGYLFPDTYRFFNDSTIDEIIIKMLQNFEKKFDDQLLPEVAKSGMTVHEVVTLASIVEKEVRGAKEMKTVSGLFKNRLDIGMALQADSTVGYLTKSGRDRSTIKDLEIDSLYNTYKYAGLPPGPISNPGLSALEAAVYPTKTDYLYFLTDGDGAVHYAQGFDGHQRNRQLYLK